MIVATFIGTLLLILFVVGTNIYDRFFNKNLVTQDQESDTVPSFMIEDRCAICKDEIPNPETEIRMMLPVLGGLTIPVKINLCESCVLGA